MELSFVFIDPSLRTHLDFVIIEHFRQLLYCQARTRKYCKVVRQYNNTTLFWVPRHSGYDGMKKTDFLARRESEALGQDVKTKLIFIFMSAANTVYC